MTEVQRREVEWYRRHGLYADRISRDALGRPYVIGDWSWNRRHPEAQEAVEFRMQLAGVYRDPAGVRALMPGGGEKADKV